jgi:DNA-binding NarL/FixJ family response regulator/signal transduction histidine kinase
MSWMETARDWRPTVHALAGLATGAATGVTLGGLVLFWLAAIWSLADGPTGARWLAWLSVVVTLTGPVLLLWAVQGFGALQRLRFRATLGVGIAAPPRAAGGGWLLLRPVRAWRAPATWRQLAYHLLAMTGGTAGGLLVAACWSAPLLAAAHLGGLWGGRRLDVGLGLAVLSAVALLAAPLVARAVARVDEVAGPALLGPGRGEELALRVESLARSRAEIIAATDAERRRIERDLHDGTQRRLVSLAMRLGMARQSLTDAPEPVRQLIEQATTRPPRAWRSCASSSAACTRPCSTTGAWTRHCRASPPPRRCRCGSGSTRPAAARPPSRRSPTSSSPRPSPTSPSTPAPSRLRSPSSAPATSCASSSATTATAAPRSTARRPPRAPDCAGWPSGPPPSTGPSPSTAPGRADDDHRGAAVRVVIAEDSVLLQAGLTGLLTSGGFEVAAAVADADQLLRAVEEHRPDVAVVDVRMPPTHTDEGIRAALVIGRLYPQVAVLVLSQYVEERYATDLLSERTNGVGYLLKDRVAHVADFLDALRRVAAGGTALDPEVVAQLLVRRRADPLDRLTPRELQTLELMAEGRSNNGITEALHVSPSAVEKYVSNIFAKLDLPPTDTDHRRVLAVLKFLGA